MYVLFSTVNQAVGKVFLNNMNQQITAGFDSVTFQQVKDSQASKRPKHGKKDVRALASLFRRFSEKRRTSSGFELEFELWKISLQVGQYKECCLYC